MAEGVGGVDSGTARRQHQSTSRPRSTTLWSGELRQHVLREFLSPSAVIAFIPVNIGECIQLWFNDLVFRKCIFDWRADPDFAKPSQTKMDVQEVLNCLQRLFITMQITPFVR